MASISIVIRALNEAAYLPRLGIARQTRKPDEIVLVDSGSTDDSVANRPAREWFRSRVTGAAKLH